MEVLVTDDMRALEELALQVDGWIADAQYEEYWAAVAEDEECKKYVEYDEGVAACECRDYWDLTEEEMEYMNSIERYESMSYE